MANWDEVFNDDLKEGDFYDQGWPEVSLPRGYHMVWEGPRSEMDFKDIERGQPEVFKGRYSGVGFHAFTQFKWWIISEPIRVTAGRKTRAKAALMVVSHGIEDDPTRPGACEMRVGLVNAADIAINADKLQASPTAADQECARVVSQIRNAEIAWSEWWGVRDTLDNEQEWKTRRTDEMRPQGAQVRLIIQCNADEAAAISAGHYDDLIVEQDLEGPAEDWKQRVREVMGVLQEQVEVLRGLID
jgi:hypothetical protein